MLKSKVRPIHPGEVLNDELQARLLSRAEFARALHISPNRVTALLNGRRAIRGSLVFAAKSGGRNEGTPCSGTPKQDSTENYVAHQSPPKELLKQLGQSMEYMRTALNSDAQTREPLSEAQACAIWWLQWTHAHRHGWPATRPWVATRMFIAGSTPAGTGPILQYSLGNRNVVTLRSASVMIHTVLAPRPSLGWVGV